MTVIRPNSVSGINSITANGGDINLFRADGTKADVPVVNNITAGVVTATKFVGPIEATTGTFSGNLGVGGVLTYEDVTNIDSVGVITARSGIKIGPTAGVAATIFADGSINSTGIITATAFHGSGANLTSMPFIAEGGVESTFSSGGTTYMLHTFLTTGVFRTNGAKTIDFLLVGGGGGSARAEAQSGGTGGGGGGGVVEGSGFSLAAGTYVVTVGAGGASSNAYTVAGNGGDTIFAGVTAKGGGGGGDYASNGANGGSGGGGAEPNRGPGGEIQSSQNSGISNIAQFGSDGGQGGEYTSNPTGGGGGGGAGGNGARPTSTDHGNGVGGAAGNGRANSITGTSTTYGRGGIGGGSGYLNAEAGLNGRGDGATGATAAGTEGSGAVGGSGIVIIRYTI